MADPRGPDGVGQTPPSSRRLLFGTEEAPPGALPLRAGPLALSLRDGALWNLCADDHEVWHGVTFPYRDPDWWTPPAAVASVTRGAREGGFALDVAGSVDVAPPLRTLLRVEGDADGTVTVSAKAVPAADLWTNRLGLCLLYPLTLAGTPCEVEHDDGRVSRSTFPTLVPPWPPFMQIRAIRHAYAPGCWASCTFAGDSFEFEDQRNNADASFKVYSRSNMMPRPYRLRAGVAVRQRLVLRVEAPSRRPRPAAAPERPIAPARALPRVGLAVRPGDAAVLPAVAAAVRPSFLHLTLGRDEAARGVELVAALRRAAVPLRLDLLLGEEAGREAFLDGLGAAFAGDVAPESVAAYPGDAPALAAVRGRFPGVPLGGGTPHFFAQMNRLEDVGPLDFLSFTLSPLVHGADDASVMLSPDSLPGMVATLRHRRPGLPVRIGPSAIAMRASPLGRQPATDGTRRVAMAGDDPRARGLFGAAWALAVVAGCADAGVEAVTLMAAGGPSAVMTGSAAGAVWHPVAAVLARLGAPGTVVEAPVTAAPGLTALAIRRGTSRELLLANLGGDPRQVRLTGWAEGARCAVLDEAALRDGLGTSALPAFAERPPTADLRLGAYAVASLREGARDGGDTGTGGRPT